MICDLCRKMIPEGKEWERTVSTEGEDHPPLEYGYVLHRECAEGLLVDDIDNFQRKSPPREEFDL